MKTFRFTLCRTINETCVVEVEANHMDEAEELAIRESEISGDWDFADHHCTDVINAEEIGD